MKHVGEFFRKVRKEGGTKNFDEFRYFCWQSGWG